MSDFFDRTSDRQYTRDYKESTPDILSAFAQFNDAVFADEGRVIPRRFRELIAVAVAVTTQCAYCIDSHTQAAVTAGATQAELAEAAWVATALRAGGGFAHGRLAFKLSGIHDEGHTHD